MRGRTFLRIMLDNLFVNNALSKALSALVNFCNEQGLISQKKLKFSQKMPLNNIQNDGVYQKKFLFTNIQNSGVDFK